MNGTTEAPATYSLADMETPLHDFRTATAMLGHMASSDLEVDSNQLQFIESRLIEAHNRIEALWNAAWAERPTERRQHETALAAAQRAAKDARAEYGPGSVAQMKLTLAALDLIRGAGKAAMAVADEQSAAVAAALAEAEARV